MANVCLTMIVKDEAHVIERCLCTVRPFIDHWLIVDTGSTDGTPALVRSLLDGIPGELVERPWKNFGHNRTEALELARPLADYCLMLDADEVFTAPERFAWPDLVGDVYSLLHLHGSTSYWLQKLVANRLPWRYEGVLHESLDAPGAGDPSRLIGPSIVGHYDGGRSSGLTTAQKYARDAETLEKALAEEPGNTRYQYYLARSYRDSEQWGKALLAFRQRATMGGFDEEVYDSLLAIATMHELIGSPAETVLAAYLAAYENRPTRAEPLCSLAHYLRVKERYALAKLFASQAAAIPRPDDILFVDESVYEWRAVDEFAVASYWAGDYEASAKAARELLAGERVPETDRGRVKANLDFAKAKLAGR
jgi:hypothetical protein